MHIDTIRELVGKECVRLAQLGHAGIADELTARGKQGITASITECPLARGICDSLLISTGRLVITEEAAEYCNGQGKYYPLVAFEEELTPLAEFVNAFDLGNYPQLMAVTIED
jgi:hypothetical protein